MFSRRKANTASAGAKRGVLICEGHWGEAVPLHLTPALSNYSKGAGAQIYQKSP